MAMTDEGNDDGKTTSQMLFFLPTRIMNVHHSFTLFTQKKRRERKKIENSSNFTFPRVASLKPLSFIFQEIRVIGKRKASQMYEILILAANVIH